MRLEKNAGEVYRSRATGCTVPAEGLLTGRLRGYPHPLPLTPDDFETWSRWAAAEKPLHLAAIESLRGAGAALVVSVVQASLRILATEDHVSLATLPPG